MFSETSKLVVKDLIFHGRHGSTGREPFGTQRFRVSLNIDVNANQAAKSDSLKDAFDYKIAVAIARHVVEGESHVLIETVASRIIQRICQYDFVSSAEVTIEKLDASQRCIPAFIGSMNRDPQKLPRLRAFDPPAIFAELDANGGVSFPILPEAYRFALLEEAEMYDYSDRGFVKQDEIVGPAKVREQLWSNHNLFSGSLFYRLRDDFQHMIAGTEPVPYWMRDTRPPPPVLPFASTLDLNELVLQRYDKGSLGITPHKDFSSNINLIAIFILTGKARFCLCDDRAGTNPRELAGTPGNVILMRAPGFKGADIRPFHFISDIEERRVVCAIRQLAPKK